MVQAPALIVTTEIKFSSLAFGQKNENTPYSVFFLFGVIQKCHRIVQKGHFVMAMCYKRFTIVNYASI